jgi:hypothetical protein
MEDTLTFNCALSSTFHKVGDPMWFGMGTPAEVSRSIHRVWEIAPTPERIVEDVTCSLTRAIDAVIAAKGIDVADLVMRSGRCGRRLDGKDKELSHARAPAEGDARGQARPPRQPRRVCRLLEKPQECRD